MAYASQWVTGRIAAKLAKKGGMGGHQVRVSRAEEVGVAYRTGGRINLFYFEIVIFELHREAASTNTNKGKLSFKPRTSKTAVK